MLLGASSGKGTWIPSGVVMSHLGGARLLAEEASPTRALGAACVIAAGLVLMALAVHEACPPEAVGRPSPARGSGSA